MGSTPQTHVFASTPREHLSPDMGFDQCYILRDVFPGSFQESQDEEMKMNVSLYDPVPRSVVAPREKQEEKDEEEEKQV